MNIDKFNQLPRIMGTETELSIPDIDKFLSRIKLVEEFHVNGSSIHEDDDEVLEYATPECLGPAQLVTHELAGRELLDNYRTHKDPPIYNRIADHRGKEAAGYHENYLTQDRESLLAIDNVLLAHLPSRVVISGAGLVGRLEPTSSSKARGFVLSQRAGHIDSLEDGDGSFKGLIDNRFDSYADDYKWMRVHVTAGDPNILAYTSWLKLGSASIALRLVENRCYVDDLIPDNPVEAFIDFAGDLSLRHTVEVDSGKDMTALDIQEELVVRFKDLAEKKAMNEEELRVADALIETIDAMRANPESLFGRIDWITKKVLIERRLGQPIDKIPKGRFMDCVYEDLRFSDTSTKGSSKIVEDQDAFAMVTNYEAISQAVTTPPPTRAAKRAQLLKKYSGKIEDVTWDQVDILYGASYEMLNPYKNKARKIGPGHQSQSPQRRRLM